MQIDHDPNERPGQRFSLGKWWLAVWAVVVAGWFIVYAGHGFNFALVGLGFGTGVVLAAWAVDMHLSSGGSGRDL
jgi:Flp pilus assembly protein TadB